MKVKVNFLHNSNGILEIVYKSDDFEKLITFDVPLDFFITSDSLVGLCIACRPVQLKLISFDFDVTHRAKLILSKDYHCSLYETNLVEVNKVYGFQGYKNKLIRNKTVLSFSGGVDSMAAHYLCESNADLLSIDFGSWFKREADFFKRWNTTILKTDFRNKPFNESDWTFMAAGGILYSDYLGIEILLWGQVLEAAPWWFDVKKKNEFVNNGNYLVFNLANIKIGQVVAALSEYGTTLVASMYGREILNKSIISAAESGSMKSVRKYLLEKIIYKEPIDEQWIDSLKLKQKGNSGKSFADDILGFYFSWKLGIDFVEKYLMNLDDQFKQASSKFNMSFFEKYNTSNMPSVPEFLRDGILNKFHALGLEPYSDDDFLNLSKVRSYLSNIYKF